ncbi:RraA family protein [Aestuariivirga sp.]|uniref:RraA family protein n=1 Tax=Aestuariivirga sp. TaxID=2650926 RepID=UPI00391C48C6
MIDETPLLRIRSEFPRPTARQVAAFSGLQTGFAADAMNGRGALDYRIKPLAPLQEPLAGIAMTCHCGPADNLALFGALASAKPGDILVAATDGFTGTAVTGDLLLGMARNLGVLGLVTDGLARDLSGILAVGIPVFCAGLTPNSPARNGPGSVGLPVVMGGVRIEPGDIILADNDGVVVIPRTEAEDVIVRLDAVRSAEAKLDAAVKGGLGVPDFISTVLSSGKVSRLP